MAASVASGVWLDVLHASVFGPDHVWYSGVWGNPETDFMDNGGPECAKQVPSSQRLLEGVLFIPLHVGMTLLAYRRVRAANANTKSPQVKRDLLDWLFLGLLIAVYAAQIRYKVLSRRVLFLMNPCHVITLVQIYLLAAKRSQFSEMLYRTHCYWLFSPVLAMVFPVTQGLDLAFEPEMYWIQHFLIATIVPLQLGRKYYGSGTFAPRFFGMGLGIFGIWMWGVLSPLGELTWVNLNCTLCATAGDVFAKMGYEQVYRSIAEVYVSLLTLVFGLLHLGAGQLMHFIAPRVTAAAAAGAPTSGKRSKKAD